MRIKNIMVTMATLLLAGCAIPSNEPDASDDAKENYQEIKDVKVAAGKVIKQNASEAVAHLYYFDQAAKAGFYDTMDHVADWMRPNKPKPSLPISASYCYRMYQDVSCYRAPMPGWESRLVGYQGTGAAPPELALMEPLPVHEADASKLPENRAKDAKPVFAALPPKMKEAEKNGSANDPITTDSSHEQVADPAVSPQL